MKSKIIFSKADISLAYTKKSKLKNLINQLFNEEGVLLESLNYIFCSDDFLLNINKKFLNHNYYTDIITFSLSDKELPIIGEAYLSIERIKENAILYNIPFSKEFERVVIHGALHLCGYKDKTQKQITQIRNKEEYYLNKLF